MAEEDRAGDQQHQRLHEHPKGGAATAKVGQIRRSEDEAYQAAASLLILHTLHSRSLFGEGV